MKNKQRKGTLVGETLDHPNLKFKTVKGFILDPGFLVMMSGSGCCYAAEMCTKTAFLCP